MRTSRGEGCGLILGRRLAKGSARAERDDRQVGLSTCRGNESEGEERKGKEGSEVQDLYTLMKAAGRLTPEPNPYWAR